VARIKLDPRGIEEVAKSREMHAAIKALAEQIADNVRSQGVRVEGGDVSLPVNVYGPENTSSMRLDRAKAYVTLAHAAGLAVQAKHGALSRAASQAGLVVRE
jgi:hypothetical protein